jgi:hypothetical protein
VFGGVVVLAAGVLGVLYALAASALALVHRRRRLARRAARLAEVQAVFDRWFGPAPAPRPTGRHRAGR